MSRSTYRTAPLKTAAMPPGIPYIIANEAAERFSFYGMKALLLVFLTEHMVTSAGSPDRLSEKEANVWIHTFTMFVYFTPIFGAMLSDAFLGKYKTIIWLSIVYCLGHLALAIDQTRLGMLIGLGLIALGSGGIKPCVSAHVGDQFGESNKHHLPRVYSWFYFSINFGAVFSMLLTPWLLERYGAHWAFGVPGIFMGLATIVFWMGRHQFAHIPARGVTYFKDIFGPQSVRLILPLIPLYLCLAIFFSLFDQTFSSWITQAKKMDLEWLGMKWLPGQITAANSAMILVFIPLFTYVIYPLLGKFFRLTILRKIGIGLFLMVGAFLVSAWIEQRIVSGETPNIKWQLFAYAILTAAEIMVSITFLEFSYTQAPNEMKSFIMSFYLLAMALGNAVTALINKFIPTLVGPAYFLLFAGMMLATAFIFTVLAYFYKEKSFVQKEVGTA